MYLIEGRGIQPKPYQVVPTCATKRIAGQSSAGQDSGSSPLLHLLVIRSVVLEAAVAIGQRDLPSLVHS